MVVRPLKSFLPTADDVVNCDLPRLGGILLVHLQGYKGLNTVWQHGGLNRGYFCAMLENRNAYLGVTLPKEPEYGPRQPEVTQVMMEAWNWLERQGHLLHNPDQPHPDWFLMTRSGESLAQRAAAYERFENLGLDRVKFDLDKYGGVRQLGGGPMDVDLALEWVREKEQKPPIKTTSSGSWLMISDIRLEELRALQSTKFDFKKLIRLCEELNTASREDCCLSVGMLTRAVLDHVPPVFGLKSFSEIANNYVDGSKSFRDTMLHLDTAAKKIADGLLHTQIRKSETLPTPQQVNFGPQLDLLLGEIVRITQ